MGTALQFEVFILPPLAKLSVMKVCCLCFVTRAGLSMAAGNRGSGGFAGGGVSGGGSTGTGGSIGLGGRGGGSGVGGSTRDAGGSGAAGGADAGAIGDGVVEPGTGGSPLSDCAGLGCRADQQVLKVASPALGIAQCACVPIFGAGRCIDCTCGSPLCDQYFAYCAGFSLEGGLLCAQNG